MEKRLQKLLPNGKFKGVSDARSRAMAAVRGSGNRTTELRFRLALVRNGIRGWKIRPRTIIGSPDFYFPNTHITIFVDGCFWHGCPRCGHHPKTNPAFWRAKIDRNRQRDVKTTVCLKEKGYRILRFWEHEIINEIDSCIARLQNVIALSKSK